MTPTKAPGLPIGCEGEWAAYWQGAQDRAQGAEPICIEDEGDEFSRWYVKGFAA